MAGEPYTGADLGPEWELVNATWASDPAVDATAVVHFPDKVPGPGGRVKVVWVDGQLYTFIAGPRARAGDSGTVPALSDAAIGRLI